MKMFFAKTHNANSACLKIINDDGFELSLAGDNSCNTIRNMGRLSLATFIGPMAKDIVGEEKFGVNAEEFLKALANHLGYEVKPAHEIHVKS